MKFTSKLIVMLILSYILYVFVSVAVDYAGYSDAYRRMNLWSEIAYHAAIEHIQSTDGKLMETVNASISSDYSIYLNQLQSSSAYTNSSNFKTVVDTLRESYHLTQSTEGLLTPLQFGLTYVDASIFSNKFETTLSDLVTSGTSYYKNIVDADSVFNGTGSSGKRDSYDNIDGLVEIVISNPKILPLDTSGNYASIFGMVYPGYTKPNMLDYIISYDITINVDYYYVTKTPLFWFKGSGVLSLMRPNNSNLSEDAHLKFKGRSIKHSYTYVLIN